MKFLSNNSMKSFYDFMKNITFCTQKCRHITFKKAPKSNKNRLSLENSEKYWGFGMCDKNDSVE
jgi:hypothetical protein